MAQKIAMHGWATPWAKRDVPAARDVARTVLPPGWTGAVCQLEEASSASQRGNHHIISNRLADFSGLFARWVRPGT